MKKELPFVLKPKAPYIKEVFVTATNDPLNAGCWMHTHKIEEIYEVSDMELINIFTEQDEYEQYSDCALWIYEGPEWRKTPLGDGQLWGEEVSYEPFKTQFVRRIRDAKFVIEDEVCEMERMERGAEAFAYGGMDEYNSVMGYGVVEDDEY